MRKFFLIFITLLLAVSCSYDSLYRTVTIEIPEHPWEKFAGENIWYNLCWSDYNRINELYVSPSQRIVHIRIPLGVTVPVCAYPIGEMQAFGFVFTPLDDNSFIQLNQNDGYLANILINLDYDPVKNLNYGKLREKASGLTDDFRLIDETELVKDILNGNLKASSLKINNRITVPPFPAVNGTWVSESVNDARIIFMGNMTTELELPPGVNRFLNAEKNLELRIVIDSDGSVYHFERVPLVSKPR